MDNMNDMSDEMMDAMGVGDEWEDDEWEDEDDEFFDDDDDEDDVMRMADHVGGDPHFVFE